jgi:hypothetical protein
MQFRRPRVTASRSPAGFNLSTAARAPVFSLTVPCFPRNTRRLLFKGTMSQRYRASRGQAAQKLSSVDSLAGDEVYH